MFFCRNGKKINAAYVSPNETRCGTSGQKTWQSKNFFESIAFLLAEDKKVVYFCGTSI